MAPPLPLDPTTSPDWYHFPSAAMPPGQGSPAAGDPGSKLTSAAYDWELDERTRMVGRVGVAEAREALRRAKSPEPKQPAPIRKAS